MIKNVENFAAFLKSFRHECILSGKHFDQSTLIIVCSKKNRSLHYSTMKLQADQGISTRSRSGNVRIANIPPQHKIANSRGSTTFQTHRVSKRFVKFSDLCAGVRLDGSVNKTIKYAMLVTCMAPHCTLRVVKFRKGQTAGIIFNKNDGRLAL